MILVLFIVPATIGCGAAVSEKKVDQNKKVDPDEAEVRQTVERYISAVKDGKINLMWSMLSTGLREKLAEDGVDQAEFVRRAEHEISQTEELQGPIKRVNFAKIRIVGVEAKVDFSLVREAGTIQKKYTLKKVSNRWRIDNLQE